VYTRCSIHPSAWKFHSANFDFTECVEVSDIRALDDDAPILRPWTLRFLATP
jgi:hypothetical protein